MDELIVLSRFFHFTALAPLFGGSLFRLYVEPQEGYDRHHWPRIDIAASLAVLISAVAWLVGVAATMTGGWAELLVLPDTVAVLIDTQFGRVWILRLALATGVLGLVLLSQKRRRAWEPAMLLFSGVLTASLAAVGHGSFGDGLLRRQAHFIGDAIHLLCAAAWLGGLIGLGLLLRQASNDDSEQSLGFIGVALARFSRLGYVTVGLLLATGVLNTISIVPRPELLVRSEYGRILLIKIGLVALMVSIALANRFILVPRLHKTERAQAHQASVVLYRTIAVEQMLGLLVLAIVAFLGTIHPT